MFYYFRKCSNNARLGQYLIDGIQTWHDGRLIDGIDAHTHFGVVDLDARSQWVGKGKKSMLNYLDN